MQLKTTKKHLVKRTVLLQSTQQDIFLALNGNIWLTSKIIGDIIQEADVKYYQLKGREKVKRFIKPFIGGLLILSAFAGLIYWENDGRERWTMEEVAVMTESVETGDIITKDMFRPARVNRDDTINGALRMSDVSKVTGMIADRPIEKKSQVSMKFFDEPETRLEKGKSIYVIKNEGIDMRSSSLRCGDTVNIYSDNGDTFFGTFTVAFVKDDNEQEVVEAEGFAKSENVLDRKMSSRPAYHIEIIASLEEYIAIQKFVTEELRSLMIVQDGDFI